MNKEVRRAFNHILAEMGTALGAEELELGGPYAGIVLDVPIDRYDDPTALPDLAIGPYAEMAEALEQAEIFENQLNGKGPKAFRVVVVRLVNMRLDRNGKS